ESGDELTLTPAVLAAVLPRTPDQSMHVAIGNGEVIRVPSRLDLFEYKGFRIPAHLISYG
ncbi:MAG TPA: hypothetical protein VF908_06420, partial [Gemmatimonadaceae bacterium]